MARSHWISDLHWVRTGQQTRSQKTQAALLDAAGQLFSENGIDATSVTDIAKRAGCSVGAVYHHFRDKQTMLYALFDRYTQETLATTKEAVNPKRWEGATISDILHGFLEFSLSDGRENAALKNACYEAARNDAEMMNHLNNLNREVWRGVTKLILARKSEIGHPEPKLAVAFALEQLGAMLRTRLGKTPFESLLTNRSDKVFIREMLRSATTYLQLK